MRLFRVLGSLFTLFAVLNIGYAQQAATCGFDQHNQKMLENSAEYRKFYKKYLNEILPEMSLAKSRNAQAPIIRIPVVVHVIHSGEAVGVGQNLSVARIEEQIQILNQDFNAETPNFSTSPAQWAGAIGNPEVKFCLATTDPNGNPTNGITRDQIVITGTNSDDHNIEADVKPATNWNPNLYYNIYTVPIPGTNANGGVTGYAYLPYNGTVGNGGTDGSVVDYRWFGGPTTGGSGSSTLTHETGHYLGLFHPFNGESCSADDGIADTPNISASTGFVGNCSNGWPTGPMSCGNEAMYINFMDYTSPDACVTSFTNGQINVMRGVLNGTSSSWASREQLANNATSVCAFNSFDIEVSKIIAPVVVNCNNDPFTPKVAIKNVGIETVTTLEINYQVNTDPIVTFNWADNLISGETRIIDLPLLNPPTTNYQFKVWTSNPNGTVDENLLNNELIVNTDFYSSPPLLEAFQATTFNPTPNGIFAINVQDDNWSWVHDGSVGAYGLSPEGCAKFDNYNTIQGQSPNGTRDWLVTKSYKIDDLSSLNFNFDYAYNYVDNTFSDTLEILASTDCGMTFSHQLFLKGGDQLATSPFPSGGPFVPNGNQWKTESIDLSSLGNPDNLAFAFVNRSGYGNFLYIDNINLNNACTISTNLSQTGISCPGMCDGSAQVSVTGAVGTVTYSWSNAIAGPSDNTATNLCSGNYSVTVSDANNCTQELSFGIGSLNPLNIVPTVTPVSGPSNNDATIDAVITGGTMGYSITWPGSSLPDVLPVANVAPGTYLLQITDAMGCSESIEITVDPYDCSSFELNPVVTNINCNGLDNGSINLNPTGGSTPYSYNWNPDVTSGPNPTGLAEGSYLVTVTDQAGCLLVEGFNITAPSVMTVNIITTDETAAGANDGTATPIVSGGSPDYTFDWGPLGNAQNQTNMAPGTYNLSVFDANSCSVSLLVMINEFNCGSVSAELVVNNHESCFGSNDGSAQVINVTGEPPYTYDWSQTGAVQAVHNSLSPGPVSVTVLDNSGCQVILTSSIDPATEISVSLSIDGTCSGLSNGHVILNAAGGSGSLSYLWEDGSTGSSNDDLSSGIHSVTITDGNQCIRVETFEVPGSIPIVSNMVVTSETAAGLNDGTITINPLGGSGNLSWEWNPPAGMSTNLTNLSPGIYSLTITDQNGCELIETGTVLAGGVDCSTLTGSISVQDVSCFGFSDGSATVEVQGGIEPYTYNWSVPAGSVPTVDGLASGTVQVTILDGNSCESIVFNSVGSPTEITLSETIIDESSPGANDGSISLIASGGAGSYTYDWGAPIGMMNPITNLTAGIYQVTCTDATGCAVTGTYTVISGTVDCSNFSVSASSVDITCNGDGNGTASATASGGSGIITYTWSNGLSGAAIANLEAGTITVTAVDDNGCMATATVAISEPQPILISGQVDHESSAGANDGVITLINSGGVGTLDVNWGPPLNDDNPIVALSPGMYTVTVSDDNNCLENATFTVLPGGLDCSNFEAQIVTTDSDCAGQATGTATFLHTGGTAPITVIWSNGMTGLSIADLPAGPIFGTGTDASGCELTVNGLINESTPISVDFIVTNESVPGANDGSVQAMASGGQPNYSYDWGSFGTGDNISNLSTGSYSVTVTDNLMCQIVETVTVSVNGVDCSSVSGTLTTVDPPCGSMTGGTATIDMSGGTTPYTYNWSEPGLGTSQSTVSVSSGPISVTVLDDNGCEVIAAGNLNFVSGISISSEMVIDASGPGMSDGGITIAATGGQGLLNYSWSNLQSGNTITNLTAGNYTVTITDASGNCELIENYTIEEGLGCTLDLTTNTTPVSCNGANDGTATVTAQGGSGNYTYEWSVSSNTNMIIAGGGIYFVTVSDGNGCVGETSINIMEPNQLSLGIQGFPGSCGALGAASALPTGGTPPFAYNWNTGANTQSINNLENGTYSLTITDSKDCQAVATVEIINNASQFSVASSVQDISCPSGNDGAISLNIVEGTPPYSVTWNIGSTEMELFDLTTGSYIVQIVDGAGCTFFKQFTLVSPGTIDISFDIEYPTGGQSNGSIQSTILGGTPPFNYTWNGQQGNSILENASPGSYICEITDANGCVYEKVINLWTVGTENLFGINEFSVYPNPTRDLVSIDLVRTDLEDLNLALYSMQGILIDQFVVDSKDWKMTITVDDYPAGVYFLYLNNGIRGIQKKLIIIR